MFPFIIFFQPSYIKKEDAREFAKNRRRVLAFVSFAGTVTSLFFALFLFPVLADSSYLNSFDLSMLPFPSYFFIVYAFIGLAMGVYYLTSEPDYKTLEEKLKRYKEGEMIRSNELMNQKENIITVTYIMFQAIPLIFFIFSSLK